MNRLAFTNPAADFSSLRLALSLFGARGWLAALAGGAAALLVIGVPTALVETPLFSRQIATRPEDYAFWVVASVLAGLIAGTFALGGRGVAEGKAATGGFLSFIAVGCPVCNKVAVAALGTTGALNVFGPAQLYIGIASIVLLVWAVLLRARAVVGACRVPGDASGGS